MARTPRPRVRGRCASQVAVPQASHDRAVSHAGCSATRRDHGRVCTSRLCPRRCSPLQLEFAPFHSLEDQRKAAAIVVPALCGAIRVPEKWSDQVQRGSRTECDVLKQMRSQITGWGWAAVAFLPPFLAFITGPAGMDAIASLLTMRMHTSGSATFVVVSPALAGDPLSARVHAAKSSESLSDELVPRDAAIARKVVTVAAGLVPLRGDSAAEQIFHIAQAVGAELKAAPEMRTVFSFMHFHQLVGRVVSVWHGHPGFPNGLVIGRAENPLVCAALLPLCDPAKVAGMRREPRCVDAFLRQASGSSAHPAPWVCHMHDVHTLDRHEWYKSAFGVLGGNGAGAGAGAEAAMAGSAARSGTGAAGGAHSSAADRGDSRPAASPSSAMPPPPPPPPACVCADASACVAGRREAAGRAEA